MKITALWGYLASYSVDFFKELAMLQDCNIQLVYLSPISAAPYSNFDLSFCCEAINRSELAYVDIYQAVRVFSPDCLLMCGWNFPDYMKISKEFRRKGVYVVSTNDHQWQGTLKQWTGVFLSRFFLKPCIDCFLVPGDRQAHFIKKLGYDCILYGLNAASVENFKTKVPLKDRPPCFLFIGRLSSEKGISNLVRAYRIYRQQCIMPWNLNVIGTGHLKHLLDNEPGIKTFGFVQPPDLPKYMLSGRALILPSTWEPWGVVIHEAAAAGLAIIATDKCGASTAFIRDGVNGYIIQSRPRDIKDAMIKITTCGSERLEEYGNTSRILAELWTPRKLAKYLLENVRFRSSYQSKNISNIS